MDGVTPIGCNSPMIMKEFGPREGTGQSGGAGGSGKTNTSGAAHQAASIQALQKKRAEWAATVDPAVEHGIPIGQAFEDTRALAKQQPRPRWKRPSIMCRPSAAAKKCKLLRP